MASTRSYLFYLLSDQTYADDTNSGLFEDQTNGGTLVSRTKLGAGGTTNPVFSNDVADLAIDPHKQEYFFVNQQGLGQSEPDVDYPGIFTGSTVNGNPNSTSIYSALNGIPNSDPYNYAKGDKLLINDIAVDQTDGRLYFTRQYEHSNSGTLSGEQIDTPDKTYSGLYYVSETGGTPVTVATGFSNPDAIALDAGQGVAFVTDSTGVGYSGEQATSVNRIDSVNLSTGAVTQLPISETYHPDSELGTNNYGGNVLDGLAVDPASGTLYFTTSNVFNNLATDSYSDTNYGIYSVHYNVSNGTVSIGSNPTITTLYSGAGTHDPGRITIDVADGVFYVVGNTPDPSLGGTHYGIWEGSLSGGTTLTAVDVPTTTDTDTPVFGYTTPDVTGDANVAYDQVPTVTAGSTVTYNAAGSAVPADGGLTTNSTTSSYYISSSISITGGFITGDVLAATTTGTFITASYSSGTLTLSGSDTTAHYQQVLDSVTYSSTASNPTASGADNSRTITYSVYDGIATGSGTSTVDIEAPPTLASGSPSVTFTGGGSPVTADPALTITGGSAASLTGATVSVTSGFLGGDTLGFTSQNGISGSYNTGTGVLVLSGSASVANYQAAIRSVTFGFSPANGNPTAGNDTSRTLSYTASDGTDASTAVTSTVSVVHAAPSVSASGTVTYTRGSTAVAVDPGLTVTAPDSGGNIASATVSIGTGFHSGDLLTFSNQNGISGSYNTITGALTLTGTATAAQYQTALDSITFSTLTGNAATGNRAIGYVVNDGTSNSATGTSTVTVVAPMPAITGAVANQQVSDEGTIQPFSGVMVTDTAGELFGNTTITLSSGGTATDADGTLSGTSLVKTGTGTYVVGPASSMTLTGELRALTFTPTPHQVAPGSTVTTGFSIGVQDTGSGTASDSTTTVIATAATDSPTITGTVAGQTTTDLVPVTPFSTVQIGDVDFGAMPFVDITLLANGSASDANGTLSGAGLTQIETGTYTLAAASPMTLTSEIEALVFTPTHDQVPVGQTVTTTFDILAEFHGSSHQVQDSTTTVVATDVPCFCAGTRIATPGGEAAVEALVAGDMVLTASGAARPVRWVGRRSYAGRFLRANRSVWPVRIRAGALADNLPERDLWVSPLHALLLDGVLVPAGELVDGAGITRERVEAVDYFHIELDSHDVLLAEGTPAESFVDDGSLGMFHNAASRPEADAAPVAFCAPRVAQGFALAAIRAGIARRTCRIAA